MSEPSPTALRREEILGELAEWMHAAARDAQRRLLASETPEEFERFSDSLCNLARGVRLSVLGQKKQEDARLAAEAKAARAEAEAQSEFVPRHIKRVRIRAAIGRHVYNELETEGDVEMFWADMNARLDELQGAPDFLETPIETLIAQLCRDLGYEPPPLIPANPGTQAESQPEPPPKPAHSLNGHGAHTPDSS